MKVLVICLLVVLTGCANNPSQQFSVMEEEYQMTQDDLQETGSNQRPGNASGSIYQAGGNVALFEDIKARNVGDILTIVLTEQTSATKSASTSTSKENDITTANPTILGRQASFSLPRVLPLGGQAMTLENDLTSDKAFTGQGDSSQSNQLSGKVAVVITKVYPNHNVYVKGKKRIRLNQGDEYIEITGIVRPEDIRSDNTILSTQIANAQISYSGTGVVADTGEMGWLSRFFNSKWWPF